MPHRALSGHAALWSSWDAFCDYHHLDPEHPADHHLVAYIDARAAAGIGYSNLNATLRTIRLAAEGDIRLRAGSVTIPAHRHLSNLHDAGTFDPALQSPLMSVGQVRAMALAAAARGDHRRDRDAELLAARDRMLAVVTYAAALRPDEWVWLDREHVQVRDGRLTLLLPHTKTGDWQRADVTGIDGIDDLDPAAAVTAYLAVRGDQPGPLVTDGHRADPRRVGVSTITGVLRGLAAAAGIRQFSAYSLRRSRSVHGFLTGADATVLRQLLRHSARGNSYRRYIDPLLAAFDVDAARCRYLNPRAPDLPAVPIAEVAASPKRAFPRRYVFLGGSLEELLADIDLPSLRVPYSIANNADTTIEQGRLAFRRWSSWAQAHDISPADPEEYDLAEWVVERLDEVTGSTVAGDLASIRIGWIDATGGDEMPGHAFARQLVSGATKLKAGQPSTVTLSREATEDDALAMLPGLHEPTLRWAKAVLLAACATRGSNVEVIAVERDTARVRIDGTEMTLGHAASGMADPVAAAEMLRDQGVTEISGTVTWENVTAAAMPVTKTLWTRLLVTALFGSGARPSDLARARVVGVDAQPGGLAVWLEARKGRRPSKNRINPELLWLPERDDALDPVAAWEAWRSWWPYAAGPLLPKLTVASVTTGDLTAYSNVGMRGLIAGLIGNADLGGDGLTPKGFRYGAAGRAVRDGMPIEAIAELLGHEDTATTIGYFQNFDPFLDGLDDAQMVAVATEVGR